MNQPLGRFAVVVMDGRLLAQLAKADVHHLETDASKDDFWNYVGIQRKLNRPRVGEIAAFIQANDATFPTSILVAADPSNAEFQDGQVRIRNSEGALRVLDGQHRLAGLLHAQPPGKFDVCVTILIKPSWEVQAHVFTAVNANQRAINPSLAKNLLQFSKIDTPEKVLHQVARALNAEVGTPTYDLIKLVGYREEGSTAMFTQHAFIENMAELIYDPGKRVQVRTTLLNAKNDRRMLKNLVPESDERPLSAFYLSGNDAAIRKIFSNYFAAMAGTFETEWKKPQFILTKSTGLAAMAIHLRTILKLGRSSGTLTPTFFSDQAKRAKANLAAWKLGLTSTDFPPGGSSEAKLGGIFTGDTLA